jgi:integrase
MGKSTKDGRRKSGSMPTVRIDRKNRQARVFIGGKQHHLGRAEGNKISPAQEAEAARIWYQFVSGTPDVVALPDDVANGPTIAELCSAYLNHADDYFRHRDDRYSGGNKHTSSFVNAQVVCRILDDWYDQPTATFEPTDLEAILAKIVKRGVVRTTANKYRKDILRIFRWGVTKKLVPASVHATLSCTDNLKRGRHDVPESEPVTAVPDDAVEATLVECSSVVAAMVRLQRLTGARPGEVCILTPSHIDMSDDVWVFWPKYWKTQLSSKKKRFIVIDAEAQEVIKPFLDRPADAYCFSPKEVYSEQAERLGDCYLTASYRSAIHRACDRAGVERWSPNQLRHARSTEIKIEGGTAAEESASLGHGAEVAVDYDHSALELAKNLARKRKAG